MKTFFNFYLSLKHGVRKMWSKLGIEPKSELEFLKMSGVRSQVYLKSGLL